MLHIFLTVGAVLASIQLWLLVIKAFSVILHLLAKGAKAGASSIALQAIVILMVGMSSVVGLGVAVGEPDLFPAAFLVCLGACYLFAIFRFCRWIAVKWSRRKLPKPIGDGDTSYFQG
jgi:hypothetical protein